MSIKKICKKLFVSLLVATTYIPFGVKINDAINSNYPAIYASEKLHIVKHKNVDFVSIPVDGVDVYVEKKMYTKNRHHYNKNAMQQVVDHAKKVIKDTVGLDYNLEIPVYVVPDESSSDDFLKEREAGAFTLRGRYQYIYIKN
ncbi:MAG: hypothetical protein IJ758_04255, partial [Clostridia bacterium]|nr:hypothetical protein [Clostridia bacterium]